MQVTNAAITGYCFSPRFWDLRVDSGGLNYLVTPRLESRHRPPRGDKGMQVAPVEMRWSKFVGRGLHNAAGADVAGV